MSKQLTLSAALSTLAMASLVLAMSFGAPESGSSTRATTAHGSIATVLLRS